MLSENIQPPRVCMEMEKRQSSISQCFFPLETNFFPQKTMPCRGKNSAVSCFHTVLHDILKTKGKNQGGVLGWGCFKSKLMSLYSGKVAVTEEFRKL